MTAWTGEAARRRLAALADPARSDIPAARIAVVVAHPDDETIGIGAQLPRLTGVTIVHVTDGAPRNMADAAALGFSNPEGYAAARRRELKAAMALAGVPPEALVGPWVSDQEAAVNLGGIARRLSALLAERRIEAVVTHAYEGGHPDHDACAFAVHAAAALVARDGAPPPAIVEMPLYHAGPDGRAMQRFPALSVVETHEIMLALGDEARRLKARMYAAHQSQGRVLAMFSCEAERFRAAPAYDFTALPNGGRLLYEQHDWGMTGARWQALARAAIEELGLEAGPWR